MNGKDETSLWAITFIAFDTNRLPVTPSTTLEKSALALAGYDRLSLPKLNVYRLCLCSFPSTT